MRKGRTFHGGGQGGRRRCGGRRGCGGQGVNGNITNTTDRVEVGVVVVVDTVVVVVISITRIHAVVIVVPRGGCGRMNQ